MTTPPPPSPSPDPLVRLLLVLLFVVLMLWGFTEMDLRRERMVPRDHPSRLTGSSLCR